MLSNFSEVMAHMDKGIENGQRCSGPEAQPPWPPLAAPRVMRILIEAHL